MEEMIKMRKLLTLLFALAVALSLSMPAMADEMGAHERHPHHKHHRHHRRHNRER
jgi:Spy/CpxP family protein refolding chaperone